MESTTEYQNEKQIEALLDRLELQNRHIYKLTSSEFLQIRPTLKHDQDIHERDLVSLYLDKLLILDYRARYIQATQDQTGERHFKQGDNKVDVKLEKMDEETDDETDDFFSSKKVDSATPSQTNIHPMDLQMAVFHSADSFLKQMLVTKLSQCQYALPLLVPDPFTGDIECPLWAFRQIQKTWKKTETTGDSKVVTMMSMPICKAETPMVFCFRLGSLSVSKSQLINDVINDRHSAFYHRNCPGSTKTRLLFDGVAEIAWYCPAGKPSDTFTDCVAFTNLHGDGVNYEKQLNIMMEESSVNVVFVPTLVKNPVIQALLKSPKPLIVLNEDSADGATKMKNNKYKVGIKDRSQADVSKELKEIIWKTLSDTGKLFQLESNTKSIETKNPRIKVDENETVCQEGFSAAMEMTRIIGQTDVSKIKKQFLSCQGELWHNWSKINKEQFQLKCDTGLEKMKSLKQQELMKLREDQCAASSGELMKCFIKHLSSLPPTQREYFLKWTQILLDAHCTDGLSSILHSYDQKWSEVLELKRNPDKSDELKVKQKELSDISTNLQSATCGLEHIFREMGQIYEAHQTLKKKAMNNPTDWSKYPELAADLMIAGHPMELMDGDAGHVPLTWISSLIDQVIHKLGDKRVFVLSVLGIQSSGKSTMLNAMFGLQFAVSAGRCTRGAFMQLVELSEDLKKNFHWDYILVVDTEGLRALELDENKTLHHDNELATFVVGVGNMTLVNIFGENPSEMQDVLQIVVQAFMRMRKVNLSPSCVFVHQNVADVGAAEKNMDGKRKLQDKLDQMVELAAKEEVCDADRFSDIIEFDVHKDVKYFAQLWEGSPPMAPPNPGYSESVQDLRTFILSKASKSHGVTLSEFKTKVQDLWAALLNENFVFSFRNTLEVAVYRKLEEQYGNWTWGLRQEMLRIEEQLYTKIVNGALDQVCDSDLHEEIDEKYNKIQNDITTYFENDKHKDLLVQWKGSFELNIKDFRDEQVRGLQRKLSDVIEQKKAGKKLDEKKETFENSLLEKSKELALQLKDKAKDEIELQKQFNRVWTRWVAELTEGTRPIENINIEQEVIEVLLQLGFETTLIRECKSSDQYKNLAVLGDFSIYVGQKRQKKKSEKKGEKTEMDEEEWSLFSRVGGYVVYKGKKVWQKVTGQLPQEDQTLIRDQISIIEQEALKLIKSKPVSERGFNSSYLCEVAAYVVTRVADFESNWKYVMKKNFTVDLILYVFQQASRWILRSHQQYIKRNDACTYLESRKSEYYSVFSSFCKGNSSAVVFAEVICEKLKAPMTEFVCNRTAIDIADKMRSDCPAFRESRLNLEKHVLMSLAEKEDFKNYIIYIMFPNLYIETFIKKKVNEYISGEGNVIHLIAKNVANIEKEVNEALFLAAQEVKEREEVTEEEEEIEEEVTEEEEEIEEEVTEEEEETEENKEIEGEVVKEGGKVEEGQVKQGDVDKWLQKFLSSLKKTIALGPISTNNFSDVSSFDFLKDAIEKGLVPIIKDLKKLPLTKIGEFRMRPDQILIDQLCNCCWETCPFCSAPCINTVKDHSPDKHCVPYHRPQGVNGVRVRGTVELVTDFCTTLVASDRGFYPKSNSNRSIPYKQFQTAGGKYAEWQITPNGSKLIYWKWFICRFQKELEDHYNLKFVGSGEIPSDWKKFSKKEAIKSLDEIYNL